MNPATLDFGTVWEDEAFLWDVEFQNNSIDTAVLDEISTSCSCVRIGTGEIVLRPHDRVKIPLVLNLLENRPTNPHPVRFVAVELDARVQTPGRQPDYYRWTVHGQVKRFLHFDPPLVFLGEDTIVGAAGKPTEVVVTPAVPIDRLEIQRVPHGWTASLNPRPSAKGTFLLQVRPLQRQKGHFNEEIKLRAVRSDGSQLPLGTFTVCGWAAHPVRLSPTVQDLGVVQVGEARKAVFLLTAGGKTPVDLKGLEELGPNTRVSRTQRTEDGWLIELEVHAEAAGPGTRTVQAIVLGAGGVTRLPLLCQWYATAVP